MMDFDTMIGLAAFLGIAMLIVLIRVWLASQVNGSREHLFELCVDLLNERRINETDRHVLNRFMDGAQKFGEGWRLLSAFWQLLLENMRGELDEPDRRIDPRLLEATVLFIKSVFAANPIAAVLCVVVATFDTFVVGHGDRRLREGLVLNARGVLLHPQII